ncbi:MAG: glycosyltransferase [Chloroflexota bacterium]|nr:glycosyltransferase [Chloroflexota bacterium]
MKTIFMNIPATGHINPALPVIRELVAHGEQVICVNTEDVRALYADTGADFIAYPSFENMDNLLSQASGFRIGRNALALTGISEVLLPWVMELITREQPDYLIVDSLCAWGRQAAEKMGIQYAVSISTFVINPRILPPMTPVQLIDAAGQFLPYVLPYQRLARRMRKKLGVRPLGLTGTLTGTGMFNVIYTSRLFQPQGDMFDQSYAFVGPSIAERTHAADFPFDSLNRPLIYISLGTINNQNLDFYRNCFAAFADYSAQFLLSAGKKTDLSALEPVPSNFIVRNFVPQLEVLQWCDLFITHGGMNSVHEGLWYGVPLVVIPQQLEQGLVALQVEKHGAGVILGKQPPIGNATVQELRAAVEQVMGNLEQFRAAAQRIRTSFIEGGGYVRAAQALMSFARAE